MKSLFICAMVLLASSCKEPRPKTKDLLTESQKEFISQSSLELRAYMDDCLDSSYISYSSCYRNFKETQTIQPKSGPSVLETAAGTAIGVGAAKLILGK